MKTLFEHSPLTFQERKKPKWYFDIGMDNDRYYLEIHSGGRKEININNYLNKWDQIEDLKREKVKLRDTAYNNNTPKRIESVGSSVYLTAYDNVNLKASKQAQMLGWEDRPGKLSIRDYVFVYNKDSDTIETCFEIKSSSTNEDPIWHDKTKISSSKPV